MKFGLENHVYKKIKNIAESINQYHLKLFDSRARGDYKKTNGKI